MTPLAFALALVWKWGLDRYPSFFKAVWVMIGVRTTDYLLEVYVYVSRTVLMNIVTYDLDKWIVQICRFVRYY